MRVLWTLLKVVIALVLVIPVSIIVLATALGIFGALLGLAILTLRLAVVGALCAGAFLLVARLVRGPAPRRSEIKALPAVDPYYESAMRELDRDLGEVR